MKKRKVAMVAACTVAVVFGAAGPALAEGSWQSFMTGWSEGHESRQWIDENKDDFNGYAHFENCSVNDFRITIYKEDFGPDTNVGSETMQCKTGSSQTSDRVYEGDVGSDEYHFTLKTDVSGGVDVKLVKVAY